MLAKPPKKQQGHGQEAEEGETGASGALQNKRSTISTYEQMSKESGKELWIVLHASAVTAGCGGIPFYMTDTVENTKETVWPIPVESIYLTSTTT